jgi:hypothetical protein
MTDHVSLRTAFADLAEDAFPIVVSGYVVGEPDVVIWRQTVTHPRAVFVSAFALRYGRPVGVRVAYANGEVEVVEPSSTDSIP